MNLYLVEAFNPNLKFKGKDYKIIALTPLVSYELDRANISYSILEDYYDATEFLKKEEAYFKDQLSWFDDFDKFLFEVFPEAKDKDLKLATIEYFHLKSMVDSLILRCKEIESLLCMLRIDKLIFVSTDFMKDTLSDSQPLLFRSGQSLFSRVAPLFCEKYGIPFERILEKDSSNLRVSVCFGKSFMSRLKARLKNYAFIENLWIAFKIFDMRMLLSNRLEKNIPKIYFLKINKYIQSIMKEAVRKGYKVYYPCGKEIVEQKGFVWRKVSEYVSKDDNRLMCKSHYSRQLGSESKIIKWINDYCGIDISKIVLPRIKWYMDYFCVQLILANDFYLQFYDSKGINLVLTSHRVGVYECGAITASKLSYKTRSGCLQHGDEGLAMKMQDLSEIEPYDYYFTTNDERESYAKKRVEVSHLGTRVFQYSNRITTLPKKRLSDKLCKMFRHHRIVVYVPTMYKWDNTFWNESRMPDTWYFSWQKELLKLFSSKDNFDFIWKAIPVANETYDPIPNLINDRGYKNIKYVTNPFIKWIHKADMVLLDYPSTALYEAAMSGASVFSLFYKPSNVVRKSFLQLFGKSVESFSSFDEGIRKVQEFLDSDPAEFIVRIARSEESIFESLWR